MGQDGGADVPAVQHDAPLLPQFPLDGGHGGADAGDGGHCGYVGRDFRRTDEGGHVFAVHDDVHGVFFGNDFHVQFCRHVCDGIVIGEFSLEGFVSDGPVHGAGIEVGIAQAGCQDFGNTAFPCACRSINSNR